MLSSVQAAAGDLMIINVVTGSAFAGLLLFAAAWDIKKLEIPNMISFVICALAILRIILNPTLLVTSLLGLLVAGLPFLLIRLIKPGSIGGGDIKLSAACGFFLGFNAAVFMLIISCAFFLCAAALLRLCGKQKAGSASAFAPYIAAGSIAAYLTILILGG